MKRGSEWREWLSTLHESIELREAATEQIVRSAETALGVEFPDALRSLLLATNGVLGPYGLWLVWPAEEIVPDRLVSGMELPMDADGGRC